MSKNPRKKIYCNELCFCIKKLFCGNTLGTEINSMESESKMSIHRGDIYYADLSPVVGSEQGGIRPVLIVQNDVGNKYSPTVIAAAITSQKDKTNLPTHIRLMTEKGNGLAKESIVLLEQIRTLDKRRLKECMGSVDAESMQKIDQALSISIGLGRTEDRKNGNVT